MAKRLANSRFNLSVYNRSPEPMKELEKLGATCATSLDEIAENCNVIILSLPSSADVEAVVVGKKGLANKIRRGSIIVDTSTIDPAVSAGIASKIRSLKSFFLDAPVSGGPEGAESGSLTFMVGGNKHAFLVIRKVLEKLGKEIVYLGNSGSGLRMKLLNQSLVACYIVACAETYLLSKKFRARRNEVLRVISNSWGDSPVFRHFMKTVLGGSYEGGATIKLIRKDVTIILQNARRAGLKMELLESAHKILSEAMQKGYGGMDASILYAIH
jgi:3-hydroxyisobutyrate dehydrogenase